MRSFVGNSENVADTRVQMIFQSSNDERGNQCCEFPFAFKYFDDTFIVIWHEDLVDYVDDAIRSFQNFQS